MSHVLHRSQPAALPSLIRLVRPAGRFGLHLFEMCMAMCVGVAVLDMPFLALATWAGYSDPIRQLPEQAAVVAAFNMSVPMAAWMRVRGHDWRCVREMSGAMFAEALLLIAVAGIGVFERGSLVEWQHSLMLPAMLVVMFFRLDVYTRPIHRAART
jgi:hypothetical protein